MLPAEEVRRRVKSNQEEKQGLRKKRRSPAIVEEGRLGRALSRPELTRNKRHLTHFKEK